MKDTSDLSSLIEDELDLTELNIMAMLDGLDSEALYKAALSSGTAEHH